MQVALRRLLLLAYTCSFFEAEQWVKPYAELVKGVQGENVVVLKGRYALAQMQEELESYAHTIPVTCPPCDPECATIVLHNSTMILKVCKQNCCKHWHCSHS